LAKAISQGLPFLGRNTRKTPVLYIDHENPLSVIKSRANILGLKEGYFLKIWGRWMANDPPPLLDDETLMKIAQELRPFTIIDSYRRVHSEDENNPERMAVVSESIKDIADVCAGVLVLYHPDKAKTSRYRGTTEILAGFDAAFALSKRANKHKLILNFECFKHRMVEEFEMSIHADQTAGLPETNGRKILKQGDGLHWSSKRGKGNALHYYPK
jgi:hypothetical protein